MASEAFARTKTPPPAWQSAVTVEPGAPPSVATRANPVCEQLTANVSQHIEKMQGLVVEIAKQEKAPPASVYGAVKQLFGQRYVNPETTQKKKTLDSEKKAIVELNVMLKSAHCAPVDVEHYVAQKNKTDPASGRESNKVDKKGRS